jgi:aminoglycoside phosphotransferase (APT) family kinase protein
MSLLSADPKMPFLREALDPAAATRALREALGGEVRLREVRLLRHKPGRRALVEYGLVTGETLLGKVRAKGLDRRSYEVQRELWEAGFPVPEPLGTVPALRMWLQRKLPGVPVAELLAEPGGTGLAADIAELIHRLHATGVQPRRRPHTMREELRILHERLPRVAESRPGWRPRIERLLRGCDRLGAALPEPRPASIHRDFYADQVLAARKELYLLDLDLYCAGDPGLDVGNFVAHVTDWSLRALGDPAALRDREEALVERFVELSGERVLPAVRAYAALTLARHVHISTLFPQRRPFTGRILELAEEQVRSATGVRS